MNPKNGRGEDDVRYANKHAALALEIRSMPDRLNLSYPS